VGGVIGFGDFGSWEHGGCIHAEAHGCACASIGDRGKVRARGVHARHDRFDPRRSCNLEGGRRGMIMIDKVMGRLHHNQI